MEKTQRYIHLGQELGRGSKICDDLVLCSARGRKN